jgi:hypothetical protein
MVGELANDGVNAPPHVLTQPAQIDDLLRRTLADAAPASSAADGG